MKLSAYKYRAGNPAPAGRDLDKPPSSPLPPVPSSGAIQKQNAVPLVEKRHPDQKAVTAPVQFRDKARILFKDSSFPSREKTEDRSGPPLRPVRATRAGNMLSLIHI